MPGIVGGTAVDSNNSFPFLTWLGDDDLTPVGLHFCGGSLISERIVLTAAHCIYGGAREPLNSQVLVRVRLLDYGKEVGIRRRVLNWKRHEAFDEVTMFNDLGLLLLDESMPNEAVVPVALAEDGRGGQRYDAARQLCAGYFDAQSARHGSCGDSGGPLLARGGEGRAWTQLGVLSWRYKSQYPDVYTRVSAYREWIQATSAALLAERRNRFA